MRFILLWLYLLIIFLITIIPLNCFQQLGVFSVIDIGNDFFLHVIVFLPWTFFQPIWRTNQAIWLVAGFLFACGSEGLQYLLPYRAWNINDLLANALGVLLGFIIFTLLKLFPQKT